MQLSALFRLAFATAPPQKGLTSLHTSNSPDHYAKGTPSPRINTGLRLIVSTWFQVLFHSPSGVLFTFPSRYLFTIGQMRVFSLGGWSPRIPKGFLVPHGTWEMSRWRPTAFAYRTFTVCGGASQLLRLVVGLLTPRPRSLHGIIDIPETPVLQRATAITQDRV
jgi:hypothetical protein